MGSWYDTLLYVCGTIKGSMPEWLKGTYCKFVGIYLRWFKSSSAHFFRETASYPLLALHTFKHSRLPPFHSFPQPASLLCCASVVSLSLHLHLHTIAKRLECTVSLREPGCKCLASLGLMRLCCQIEDLKKAAEKWYGLFSMQQSCKDSIISSVLKKLNICTLVLVEKRTELLSNSQSE